MSDPAVLVSSVPCANSSGLVGPRAWPTQPLARTLLAALAYLLCAQAGKMLALPPGNSSPVWPAAGLALAVLLTWGPRYWPGIWLGAFAFNLGLNVSAAGAAVAALIAAGSTLQAVIGERFTRHHYAAAELSTDNWRLFASLLSRGPLVCLLAASVGVATLHGFGLLPKSQLLQQWLAWAAGDILGVLLFAPFFVWAWPGERNAGVVRARRMALPLLVAAALLTLAHLGVSRWDAQRLHAEHAAAAHAVFEGAALPLHHEVAGLAGVERLFAASDEVTRTEFATLTGRLAARPALLAVEWAPRVSSAERAGFERGLDADTPNAQRIVELDARHGPVPAGAAAEYFPVQYSEPRQPNVCAIGLDYRFDAARVAAREAARDRADAVASTALHTARGSGTGHQVFVPVYRKGFDAAPASVAARREALRGYVVGLFDTEVLLAPLAGLASGKGLTLRVTDVTPGTLPLLLMWTSPGDGVATFSRIVRFADRQWRVELGPAPGSAAYVPGLAAQVLPAVSVAFALLVCFAFIGAAGRSEAMARDQQQREQFQAAQRASELYLATTLQSIADAVIAADANGAITRINRAAERLTGLCAASAPGRALTETFALVDEATRKPIALEVGPVARSGVARELGRRAVLVAGDGSEHPIVGNIAPIVGADGSAQGVVLVIREVAEERAMLAELIDSEARFRALTSLSSDWFWEQDAELRFVQITTGAHDAGGIPHEAHVGKTRWELPYTDIVSSTWEAHRAELQARRPFHDLLLCRTMPQGRRYVLVSGAPRYAADGSFAGYRGVGRDVTQQKQAEIDLIRARDEAQAASRAKSAFLANMSHEIRTPMNGVIGMADVLAGSTLSADQDDAVQTIRSSALSLLGLIDDLLDFSKIEAGRLELNRSAVELGAVVEGVCRSLLELALRGNVLLSVFVDPRIPAAVWSDLTRLRQVLTNLVGNAIKFSGGQPERPGRVAVRVELTSTDPPRLSFGVIDNGIGMSEQSIAGLFTSFTQAEASTTRRFGGSGLGLAISRRLVELMQGTIGVQSKPQSGSVFTVELPLEPVDDHPQPVLDDLSGVECIVVEMPPLATSDLCVYLEHAGAQVRRARDADHALQLTVGSAQPVVLVRNVDGDGRVVDPLAVAFAGCEQIHHLLLRRGRYGRARSEGSDTVTIDADALTRAALLAGVAMAAGRRSPKAFRSSFVDRGARDELLVPTLGEARAAGRLVLVAEDDLVNQKVILRQLALLGLAAEVGSDGAEALELWRAGGHAVLLSDLHMPTMDGYTLAQRIRSEEGPGARMPILALTANALQGEAAHARACGMDDYLTKPIQLHELKAALQPWIAPAGRAAAITPPDAHPARAPVDLSVLRRLVGDDDAVVDDFLRGFLASTRKLWPALRAAGDAGDAAKAAATAHKLKSSSRSIGALALGDLCAELENAGRAGKRDELARCLRAVDGELARVEECLLAALLA